METSKKQTSKNGEGRSMFFQEDSHASLSQLPESEKERLMTVISGRKCFAQLERFNRPGLLLKMLMASSLWYSPAVKLKWRVKPLLLKRIVRKQYKSSNSSQKSSVKILSKKVIPSNRLYYQLVALKRPTGDTGRGLLPTPTAMMPGDVNLEKLDKRREKVKINKKNGNGFGVTLNELARRKLLPTPIANDSQTGTALTEGEKYRVSKNGYKTTGKLTDYAVSGLLPTPTASDGFKTTKTSKQDNLNKTFHTGATSQLNPLFVAEMMGFPPDWTVLPFLRGDQKVLKDSEIQ